MVDDADRSEVWAIVVAAGGGTRFGSRKQYVTVAGRRVLDWSLDAASSVAGGVVVVVPADDAPEPVDGADVVVPGGASRSESVRRGLAAVPDSARVVVVHDAARPAATPALFARVVAAVVDGADAAVPGVPVTDSLRRIDGGAVDRDAFVAVQTPQAFAAAALRRAHAAGGIASDDATLVEAAGGSIVVVEGEADNRKLTHPGDDVVLAEVLGARSR